MVGKGIEPKTSRIFQQCYVKCCKLQNLTPITAVIPSGNGKVLDFCVDRIKYVDWPPILNALSCDLSLHSVSIRCRQQVKTVLEQIDCERLAKTVTKRAVILTKFMLTNLMEAVSQLLANTTLLTSLLLEGLPLKIPYLNPLSEVLLSNSSLQHLYLSRCCVGDAGCLALCTAVRCLPNILTLDLSGCELTPTGAGYIADLVKYQKIHRYSENWIHTLRYRLPELDTMAGLRRISLCANPQLGDVGVVKLLDVLADDLWIKALDIQNCGITENTAATALKMMQSNTTLVILDMRHNPDVMMESLSKIRAALRNNERGMGGQYTWLSNVSGSPCDGRSVKSVASKNSITKDRVASMTRNGPSKFVTKAGVCKKEKDYAEVLEEQLQEEISHRQQLEELNLQLVDQMKQLKQQQIQLWANGAAARSSGSEQSFEASSRSCDRSSSSGSASSVPIDQSTLAYIQQAFKDIYAFIKNNQCNGHEMEAPDMAPQPATIEEVAEPSSEMEEYEPRKHRINFMLKKVQSTHVKVTDSVKMKGTKSAHLLGDSQRDVLRKEAQEMKPEMIERQMGDSRNAHIIEEHLSMKYEKESSCGSVVSDSSDTLVCSPAVHRRAPDPRDSPPAHHRAPNPRAAFYSSDSD